MWIRSSPGLSLFFWTAILALVLSAWPLPAQAQGNRTVDLELTLLVDVSASVSDEEFQLQAQGLAWAFRSRGVLDAIRSLAHRGLAVSVIQWADQSSQQVSIGWTLLRGEGDAMSLSARIAAMPRLIHSGHTAIGNALTFGMKELEANRFEGLRRVIDVSGDGRANDGRPLRIAREEVLAQGITINGLAILNEIPRLDVYFRDWLIGGEGAFLIVANDYNDFAQAMAEKLIREIRSIPISDKGGPMTSPNRRAGPLPVPLPLQRLNQAGAGTFGDWY